MRSKLKYTPDYLFKEIFPDRKKYRQLFTIPVAEGLYKSLMNSASRKPFDISSANEFSSLTKDEQLFWYDYADAIPVKLKYGQSSDSPL